MKIGSRTGYRTNGISSILCVQAAAGRSETEEVLIDTLKRITGMLQQSAQPAKDDGKPSPAEVLQLLASTLSTGHRRLEETTKQVPTLSTRGDPSFRTTVPGICFVSPSGSGSAGFIPEASGGELSSPAADLRSEEKK